MLQSILHSGPSVPAAFQGQRASFVALSAVATLGISLLCSLWHSDVSGSIAVLGLLAVYLASQELLLLYIVFSPASVVVDIIRLAVMHGGRGRGWLIFFTVCEMAAALAGSILAWSLYRTASQGGEVPYQPVGQGGAAGGAAGSSGAAAQGAYGAMPSADPFAAYQPPDALHPPLSSTYQPFPSSQPASAHA